MGDQLDHRGMKLVFVAHGRGAAFQIADIGPFVGDDQGPFELPGIGRVDPEIGRQLHGAAHALGYIDEGAVAIHRRIQRGEKISGLGHHITEIFPYQLGMLPHRLADRTENDADLFELVLEGGRDRNAVEHRVHRDASQYGAFMQGNAELVIHFQQLGIDLIQALGCVGIRFRRRVVIGILVINGRIIDQRPIGLVHIEPQTVSLQPPLKQPVGFVLLARNKADDVLVQPLGREFRFDLGDKTILIFAAFGYLIDGFGGDLGHRFIPPPPRRRPAHKAGAARRAPSAASCRPEICPVEPPPPPR